MTLVERPDPRPVMRPTDRMHGAITDNDDLHNTCRCADPDLIRLLDLINSGVDQFTASKLLWGDRDQLVIHRNEPCSLVPVLETSGEEAAPGEGSRLPVGTGSERAASLATSADSSSPERARPTAEVRHNLGRRIYDALVKGWWAA